MRRPLSTASKHNGGNDFSHANSKAGTRFSDTSSRYSSDDKGAAARPKLPEENPDAFIGVGSLLPDFASAQASITRFATDIQGFVRCDRQVVFNCQSQFQT